MKGVGFNHIKQIPENVLISGIETGIGVNCLRTRVLRDRRDHDQIKPTVFEQRVAADGRRPKYCCSC